MADKFVKCSIEGCDKPVRGRGWCSTHYSRFHRKGVFKPKRHTDPSINLSGLSMFPRYPKQLSDVLAKIAETAKTEEEFVSRKQAVMKKWLQRQQQRQRK